MFLSPLFEALLPLCSLAAETSLGSDHTPLVFYTGKGFPISNNIFFFETSWFEREDLLPLVVATWDRLLTNVGGRDIMDWWNFMSAGLRQHLRGWSQNLGCESRATKVEIFLQIA